MKTLKLHQLAMLAFTLLFGATVSAAPTSGPYITDPQNEYVQDATSEAIANLNMILCIMNGMNMNGSGMVNGGAYVALVDMNKCQTRGSSSNSSSSASGASASVNYMTSIVDVTRASNTAPMIANIWISQTEQGLTQDIYVKVTATSSPTDVPPYGVFRMDFLGKDTVGVMQMNGYIDSATSGLQYFEHGPNSSNIALALTATNTVSGSGTMTSGGHGPVLTPVTYNFNYNPANFRRADDSANDRCFDRLKAHADRSVWRYGTYNNSDGTRVDQANPSFQTKATYGGNSYYGYAGYWGIGFQGLDLNALPDGPVSGLVVHDQRPNNTTTYSLSKVKGKLTKWQNVPSTLAALDGIPFTFNGNLAAGMTTGNNAAQGWGNWQMVWNNAGTFTVTGMQTCGTSGCTLSSLNPVATVVPTAFNTITISGWSDSFGGNLNIPSTGSPHISTDAISYFSQSTVIPGSAVPATLYCLSNCPDATSIAAANAYNGTPPAPSPFGGTTGQQWNSAPSITNTVSYTFTTSGLQNGGSSMIVTNPLYFAAGSNYQYGVMSGRLFDAAFTSGNCAFVGAGGTVCEPSAPSVYYTWSTSTDQWNQTMWLTSGSTIVAFDPPQNIQYIVPSDTAGGPVVYGTWGGKTIRLQFNGFGNLGGIPGSCVDPVTNAVAACSQNTRYVPAFPIPDGATMTLGGATLIVKALDAEIRLKDIGPGATTAGCGATLPLSGTMMLPTAAGAHDVSAAMGTYSVGPKPINVTTAPKVIDGMVQY